jgi:hypothetical protein
MPLVVSSTLLFFIGVAFCYFFVFGQVFSFIQSFAPKSITAAPDIEAYLSFVLSMFLAFGLAFEVPVAVVVLARMGVVTIQKLKDFRGYFVARCGVAAGTGHTDVPALRAGYLGRANLHQAHPGPGCGCRWQLMSVFKFHKKRATRPFFHGGSQPWVSFKALSFWGRAFPQESDARTVGLVDAI